MAAPLETQYLGSSSSKSNINDGRGQLRDEPQEYASTPSQNIHSSEKRPQSSLGTMVSDGKLEACKLFEKVWALSTEDNNIALYGFRRFKTIHLMNLRLLEDEIDRIDHQIYQAGLKLTVGSAPADRLGLKHCKKDEHALRPEEAISEPLISRLRNLLQQYDDGLAAFNRMMAMETCSMIDDERRLTLRNDLSLYEIYKTRLVRVDLGPRMLQDPCQRCLHKCLRWFRYQILSRKTMSRKPTTWSDNERGVAPTYSNRSTQTWSYQNTVALADTIWRILVALVVNVFIVVPLAILSYQSSKATQLITISVWIVVFSFLTSIFLKTSNQATVAVIAAYAAVLSVFISNGSAS